MHCISAVNTHGTPVSSMQCTGTGLTRATLPQGWSARPHPVRQRDWAHPFDSRAWAWLTPPTSAPGPNAAPHAVWSQQGAPAMDASGMMARVQQPEPFPLVSANTDAPICDGIGLASAEFCHETGLIASHLLTGTGLTPATSAQGPDRPASALFCTRAGRTPPTPATGLGPPRPHLHRD
jgi:hypothetical protein